MKTTARTVPRQFAPLIDQMKAIVLEGRQGVDVRLPIALDTVDTLACTRLIVKASDSVTVRLENETTNTSSSQTGQEQTWDVSASAPGAAVGEDLALIVEFPQDTARAYIQLDYTRETV